MLFFGIYRFCRKSGNDAVLLLLLLLLLFLLLLLLLLLLVTDYGQLTMFSCNIVMDRHMIV